MDRLLREAEKASGGKEHELWDAILVVVPNSEPGGGGSVWVLLNSVAVWEAGCMPDLQPDRQALVAAAQAAEVRFVGEPFRVPNGVAAAVCFGDVF